jgi:uracil-DNA glycosylase
MTMNQIPLTSLLEEIRACQLCKEHLPFPPRPVVRAHATARLLIIGQAPGTRVQASGIPWDDASGMRLRQWLNMTPEAFYDEKEVAIIPMGFCYPGKGKSGDLPPGKECAPTWHPALLRSLPNIQHILLIGQYAQNHYLPGDFLKRYPTLTERVRHWYEIPSPFFALPHPSPRNRLWIRKNPWFEDDVVPALQQRLDTLQAPDE